MNNPNEVLHLVGGVTIQRKDYEKTLSDRTVKICVNFQPLEDDAEAKLLAGKTIKVVKKSCPK